MIKVTVMYPYRENARFDFDYYLTRHMPMMQAILGAACLRWEVDRGIWVDGGNAAPPYVAVAHLYCTSLEAFQAATAPHAAEIRADVANYTDLQPVRQISEVMEKV